MNTKYFLLSCLIWLTYCTANAIPSYKKLHIWSDSLGQKLETIALDTTIVPLVELGARNSVGLSTPIDLTGLNGVDLAELDLKAAELVAAIPSQYRADFKIFYFAMYPGLNDLKKDADGHSLLFKAYEDKVKLLSPYYIIMGTMARGAKDLEFDIEMKLPPISLDDKNLGTPNISFRSNNATFRGNDPIELTALAKNTYKASTENGGKADLTKKEAIAISSVKKTLSDNLSRYLLNPAGLPIFIDGTNWDNIKRFFTDVQKYPYTITGWITTADKEVEAVIENGKFKGYREKGTTVISTFLPVNVADKIEVSLPYVFESDCKYAWYNAFYNVTDKPTDADYKGGSVNVYQHDLPKVSELKGIRSGVINGCVKKHDPTQIINKLTDSDAKTIEEELVKWLNETAAQNSAITGQPFTILGKLFITTAEDILKYQDEFSKLNLAQNDVAYWFAVDKTKTKLEEKYTLWRIKGYGFEGPANIKDTFKELLVSGVQFPFKAIHECMDLLSKGLEHIKIPPAVYDCGTPGYNKIYARILSVVLKPILTATIAIPDGFKPDLIKTSNVDALNETEFAFYCGVWNGTIELVKGAVDLVGFVANTGATFGGNISQGLSSVQAMEMKDDDTGNNLCASSGWNKYSCMAKIMMEKMWNEQTKTSCTSAQFAGSIIGPIVAIMVGNAQSAASAAGSSATWFSRVFSFFSWCDKIGDPFRYASMGFRLAKNSAGKLVFRVIYQNNVLAEMVEEVAANGTKYFKFPQQIINGVNIPETTVEESVFKEMMEKAARGEAIEIGGKTVVLVVKSEILKKLLKSFYDTHKAAQKVIRDGANNTVEYFNKKTNQWFKIATKQGDEIIPDNNSLTNGNKTVEEALDDSHSIECDNGACAVTGNCFIAGTKVHTRSGIKKIEDVRENEEVLAFDEKKKTTTFARVALAFSLTAQYLTKVIIGKDTLTTTPNHPFYVPTAVSEADGTHWLQAGSLRKGMLVLLASGVLSSVDTIYTYAANAPVYNFEIAEHHNYYVGESGVLVHNGVSCVEELIKSLFGSNLSQVQLDNLIKVLKNNPDLLAKFRNKANNVEAWKKIHDAPNANDALKRFVELPDGVNENLLKFTDKTYKDFMSNVMDDNLIDLLKKNEWLAKAFVSHKDPSFAQFLDKGVEEIQSIADPILQKKVKDWLDRSQDVAGFRKRMTDADVFAKAILDNLKSKFIRFQKEVTFDVIYNGKTYRTRLDGIGFDAQTQKYYAIECKMGNATLSENQQAFLDAIAFGGEIKPVAGNADAVFKSSEIGTDIRSKFQKQWYKNETLTPL